MKKRKPGSRKASPYMPEAVTPEAAVKRRYPSARAHLFIGGDCAILANNGSGNILARADTEYDAWRAAANAIQQTRRF